MSKKRFEFEKKQNTLSTSTNVIVDSETGVQYLFVTYGYGGGMTVLVDRNGKPLIKTTGSSPEIK